MPWSSVPPLAVLLLLASFACTGLGMLTAAIGLRMRDVPIIANLTMAVLLIFCGVNVPLDKLPDWMHAVAKALPMTHAIAAARKVADGASLASVRPEMAAELALGSHLPRRRLRLPPLVRARRPAARHTRSRMRFLRLLRAGFVVNVKMLATSSFFMLIAVAQPVIFATIAYYMFRSGGREGTLLYASLGAGMMGVWSTTLFASGGMIQWQRWQGTLELGVASPVNLTLVYLPFSLANSFTGAYALAATLIWGRLIFGVPLHFVHPWLFVLAVPTVVLSLALLGLLLASTFVLYRNANAMSNLLEYPVWIASGLVFSTAILPGVDASDLVDPAAVLGHHRAAPRRVRRRGVVPALDGAGARPDLGRDRDIHPALVRVPGPRARDAGAHMNFARIFFVGGLISYRALFNWIRPSMYIPTMLGSPLFQLIFFTKLGQFAHAESADFYIVGNSVQVAAMASIYGMAMAIANERSFGTLGPLLATPANRAAVFLGRGLPVLANGLFVSLFTFAGGRRLPRLPPRPLDGAGSRRGRRRHDDGLHVVRDDARLDRAACEGLHVRREPDLLPDAALLRRQHPALGAARAG